MRWFADNTWRMESMMHRVMIEFVVDVPNADVAGTVDAGAMTVDFEGFGRYGKLVPPVASGNAQQWKTFAFKWFGAYKVFEQGHIMRAETSASMQ